MSIQLRLWRCLAKPQFGKYISPSFELMKYIWFRLFWGGLEQPHIQFKESMLVHGRRKFKVARRWRKKSPNRWQGGTWSHLVLEIFSAKVSSQWSPVPSDRILRETWGLHHRSRSSICCSWPLIGATCCRLRWSWWSEMIKYSHYHQHYLSSPWGQPAGMHRYTSTSFPHNPTNLFWLENSNLKSHQRDNSRRLEVVMG